MDEIASRYQQEFSEQLSDRLTFQGKRLPASVRSSFVVHPARQQHTSDRKADEGARTPLSVLLGHGGGRGGGTRLKLYLTLLWTAKSAPYDVRYDPEAFAYLLGMDDPKGKGRRAIVRNLSWLERESFLVPALRPDGLATRALLEDSGRGVPYEPPAQSQHQLKKSDPEYAFHYWFKIPPYLWTSGLIAVLNAVELACLLILLDDLRRKPESVSTIWWSEKTWRYRYGISDDTRQRGFVGLIDRAIVDQRPGHVVPSLDNPRGRHPTYVLVEGELDGRR